MTTIAFPREYVLPILVKIGTPSFRRFVINLIPWKKLHKLRDIIDVLHQTSIEILNEKKEALEKGNATFEGGKDILSILVRANSQAADVDKLSEAEILGQEKLRMEIAEAISSFGENIPYDELVALPFLDAVCRETLRL
ncbi:hypothetical protein H0H81_010516 [Sphagnurus paluster]|uniref:Uncharacterized protein n=1 Tax=Sphagnurus paluster TaxID=117069 RepID=A0A9P7KII7_9AGAR|nr:hypothetical protein H0H81_010516 [Sphagnurus paluster]